MGYARAVAASIPCRSLAAAVAGDAMNARSCPAAAGSAQETEIPPEKVVMLWIAGGNGPTTSMFGTFVSSLSC